MSDSSKYIPVVGDKELASGIDAQAADRAAEESEKTGKIPRSEVEDLKDSIGGGETLDDEAGVTTRGVKNDAFAQEKQVDKLDL
ncbi:hypothetical protein QFC22_004556 [Naganishia vaughanmartiniae]|uniref:Uncharacterized protein n=1 Tax=Naganishia vaughanmartiniae TaxID=1424756 RepID=A0ACC2X0F6_9TREE|nr:hypothetical protein QFC22_004556 [Naganishia vaughanmartiniae]